MNSTHFFEWLGNLAGELLSAIVHALRFVIGGISGAIGEFAAGLAHAVGVSPSIFNLIWLAVGLLLLVAGIRALMRRAIVSGIIWLILALLVLGRLIH
jgi:phage-related protein